MARSRDVREILSATPTVEGAGVRLKRAFGHAQVPRFDPFLMLDDFHSANPADYRAGFPWHPHRGIETITYLLHGHIEHRDSLGNQGIIGPGDIQWMTAGSGVIHQEMPLVGPATTLLDAKGVEQGREPQSPLERSQPLESPLEEIGSKLLWGFQLWANLPAAEKMTTPRYRDLKSRDIPSVDAGDGVIVRVVSGEVEGISGPVTGIAVAPEYLDLTLAGHASFVREVPSERNVFAYVIAGRASFAADQTEVEPERTVLFGEGDAVSVRAGEDGARLLLVSGAPLKEPVAWGGPIVMNTEAQLQQAFREYREGTFVRDSGAG